MVGVEEVECGNCFGTVRRRRVQPEAQELTEVFEEPVLGTLAETDSDDMLTGIVDNTYFLRFRKS